MLVKILKITTVILLKGDIQKLGNLKNLALKAYFPLFCLLYFQILEEEKLKFFMI